MMNTTWTRYSGIAIDGENPVAERTYDDGATAIMWLDARDGEVRPTITIGELSTDTTEDWPAIESYLPRSQWPEGIYAGKREDAHTNVDPLLVELIEQYRAELAADADE